MHESNIYIEICTLLLCQALSWHMQLSRSFKNSKQLSLLKTVQMDGGFFQGRWGLGVGFWSGTNFSLWCFTSNYCLILERRRIKEEVNVTATVYLFYSFLLQCLTILTQVLILLWKDVPCKVLYINISWYNHKILCILLGFYDK